jgi:carbonic anhydrase
VGTVAFVSTTDDLLRNAERYADGFDQGSLSKVPSRAVAVVSCMDARFSPYAILGLREGEAHVIRNAGGVVTDDVIRSLIISQRLLDTNEIILIQHTDCGMLSFTDDEMKKEIERETGIRPRFAFEAFRDLEAEVRQSLARIQANPFIPNKNARGFVYEVEKGWLREVASPA